MPLKNLDWSNWLYGVGAAFIGGGSSAVTAGITASAIKPEAFNLGSQLKDTLILMGCLFVINGCMSMFFYLKQSPLPKEE